MKNSYHRNRHLRKKSIKEAEKEGYATDEKAGWDEKEKERYFTNDKKLNIDRGKVNPNKKHSKTSPKETTWHTEPDNIHKEGKRWMRTVVEQTKSRAKNLKSKIDKYYPRKKK
ncbi:hypothetical protein COB21_01735 [Candidatus Aerophobetes bacterium]|uniref:Uncharacterized protein n=1 Tax=Aerophobetes bacterium TaxID=2030807 RepID=A0A2A4X6W1_UNCAE|nr:MAG: hypothetical protein COB21_01735 [Candidatus Aerophobetes bacterium]